MRMIRKNGLRYCKIFHFCIVYIVCFFVITEPISGYFEKIIRVIDAAYMDKICESGQKTWSLQEFSVL